METKPNANQPLPMIHNGSIESYLDELEIKYEILPHEPTRTLNQAAKALGINRNELARAVILQDKLGMIMAILPAGMLLDFSVLCEMLNRELEMVTTKQLAEIFTDCEPGSYPPLPDKFGLSAIVDSNFDKLNHIYFEPGRHDTLIRIKREDLTKITASAWCGTFATNIETLTSDNVAQSVNKFTPKRIEDRLNETFELPAIPAMASQILDLSKDDDAGPNELAKVISHDPALSAQLIHWARSPYYGFAGKIDTVQDAILKVLGFDMVLNLALGISVGKTMRVPLDGPIGLAKYWEHAINCASMCEKLVRKMPAKNRLKPGLAYLCGLLHNFGYLLLGQIFPPQFYLLNRYLEVNPDVKVSAIESHVLGVMHEQIGAWLMEAWHMPPAIISAVKWHHEEEYSDEYATYSNLVLIANSVLAEMDIFIGDAPSPSLAVLESVHLTTELIDKAKEEHKAKKAELKTLATQLIG